MCVSAIWQKVLWGWSYFVPHCSSMPGTEWYLINTRRVQAHSVAQSCLTLQPHDCSPPGSTVHGISLARILEWVAISSSRGSFRPKDRTCASCVGRWILYCLSHREVCVYLYLLWIFLNRTKQMRWSHLNSLPSKGTDEAYGVCHLIFSFPYLFFLSSLLSPPLLCNSFFKTCFFISL